MCWQSCKKPKLNIADDDIITYKVVFEIPNHFKSAKSLYYNFHYYMNYQYHSESLKVIEVNNPFYPHYAISKGFHSYKNFAIAEKALKESSISSYLTVVKCIIPENSSFYENEDGEIVSDSIIIISKTY